MDSEKTVERISLRNITVSHNPRHPAHDLRDHLIEEGYFIEKDGEQKPMPVLELIHTLALSDVATNRAKFVELIEKYETGPKGIVELAASRRNDEIQPITLRSYRVVIGKDDEAKKIYEERYGIVAGERRCLAAAYNFAKYGEKETIGSLVRKITVSEAYDLAVAENAMRKDATDLEYGIIFRGYREQINPETNKPYVLKEIADKLSLDYQFVRGREALTYLPEADQRRLDNGTLGVTVAIDKGIKIKQSGNKADGQELPDKKETRQRALTLAQIQEAFDDNRNRARQFLEALALVMQIELDVALKESDKRIISIHAP